MIVLWMTFGKFLTFPCLSLIMSSIGMILSSSVKHLGSHGEKMVLNCLCFPLSLSCLLIVFNTKNTPSNSYKAEGPNGSIRDSEDCPLKIILIFFKLFLGRKTFQSPLLVSKTTLHTSCFPPTAAGQHLAWAIPHRLHFWLPLWLSHLLDTSWHFPLMCEENWEKI